jgi:zinc protease
MKQALTILMMAFVASAWAATPGVDSPPEPGPALPISVPAFETFTLANGLRVVVAPRRGVPLVSASLLVLAGREAEPEGRTGLADMTAALLGKGARRDGRDVDATTLARQAEALGGTLDSNAGWRSTGVGMTVTTPRLAAALALMADVSRAPLLAPQELDRVRLQALDGLRVALDAPGSVADLAARRSWWGVSVYGRLTTPTTLQRLSIDDVRAFHARHWRPDSAVLVLAGDVDAAGVRPLAEAALGSGCGPPRRRRRTSAQPPRPGCRRPSGSTCPAAARAPSSSRRRRCPRARPRRVWPKWRTRCSGAATPRA